MANQQTAVIRNPVQKPGWAYDYVSHCVKCFLIGKWTGTLPLDLFRP